MPSAVTAPIFCVVLAVPDQEGAEAHIRTVIRHKRGDLRSLSSPAPQAPGRLHLRLGVRRIDDVLAALEGAGFAVDTVVATTEPAP
jgi:hypothetical protein